ncbi:MAG TPA: chromate efflux transporter [Burkholderiales bacterium]|nr:chromate efflux transporter [Burkholderiales bacterium]
MNERNRRMLEVAGVFLKIGTVGFGAPAIWGLIQAEVQERRAWLTKERYLEGYALVQTLPGPPALQMCIFAGHQRAGWWGGLVGGLAFTVPAFAIMLALTALYSYYGAVPVLRDALYGLGPVVLGIFIATAYRLGRNAIVDRASIAIAIAAAAAVAWLGVAGTLLLAGCAGVALRYSRRAGLLAALATAILIAAERAAEPLLAGMGASAGAGASRGLWDVGIFFLKVGAVTFGGGLSIIAFIQDQVVNQFHWITPQEFIDGLAIGQLTPGPIIMVAAYVGYKVAGVAGAAVAALAIFLPSFVLMLSILPVLDRVRRLAWIKAAMKGISPAVIATLAVTIIQLAPHAANDAFTTAVLLATVVVMLAWQRLPVLPSIACGGLAGIVRGAFR